MNNEDVAAALNEIAELLELKKESTFRIRAYQNAARTLGGLPEDVRQMIARGELEHVRGIGEGIAKKIVELIDTGHVEYLDALRKEFPAGVRALLSVPGVGPSLARRVYRELGVQSPDELRAAGEDGRLASCCEGCSALISRSPGSRWARRFHSPRNSWRPFGRWTSSITSLQRAVYAAGPPRLVTLTSWPRLWSPSVRWTPSSTNRR